MRKLPDGQISKFLSSPNSKNIPLNPSGKSPLRIRPSRPQEGRLAIVTDVGRDAVDAAASARKWSRRAVLRACERLTACRRTALLRTAKSCGPDVPTLASSFAEVHPPNRVVMRQYPQATAAKEPGHRGEHERAASDVAKNSLC